MRTDDLELEEGITLDLLWELAGMAKLGGDRAAFDADPQAELARVGQRDALEIIRLGYRPLLPSQVRLRQRLEQEWAREGAVVEDMAVLV